MINNSNINTTDSKVNIMDSMRHDYVMHVVPIALSVIRDTWHKAHLRSAYKPSSLGIKALFAYEMYVTRK